MKIDLPHTFRAFRNRNYALFFAGQGTSQIGTWMQKTGVAWVVYTMTHSAFMLGLTVFCSQFPSFVLSLYGGILADRYSRYKILLITQSLSMLQAVLLAALTLSGSYEVWQLLALSVLLGIINAFDVPARQPMVHEMINDKSDLPNALAFNASLVNMARIIGPALSGIILEKFGAGTCFLLNAISFVAVISSLLLMKLPVHNETKLRKKISSELTEGFTYLKHTPSLAIIIILLSLVSLLVLPYDTLLPVFAKVVFKGNATTFGYIRSFIGVGAIAGAFFLASLKPGTDLRRVLLASTTILGLGLICFSHISYFPVAMIFAVVFGFGGMTQNTICLTIIQRDSDATMRGRVISYVAMSIFGMMPLGSLLIGAISQKTGGPNAILGQGIVALIIVAVFYRFLARTKPTKPDKEAFEEVEMIEE